MRKFALSTLAVFVFIIISLALTYWSLKDNIHVVIPHQIYRSAQLSGPGFETLIKSKHIRTILNLRGPHPGEQWYDDEVLASRKLGVRHVDLELHAYALPPAKKLRQLVYDLQHLPRPLLVHCMGGSDRTGLASAIALILNGDSLKIAKQQYSPYYFVVKSKSIAKLVFPFYTDWLAQSNLPSNKQNFLKWVAQTNLKKRS